jgi:hypothetical protein
MTRAMLLLVALVAPAAASPDAPELDRGAVIYARGSALYKADAKGKGEAELAPLPKGAVVRALRSDASGSVLLVDLSGKWSWLRLDGQAKTLAPLPCADGPAELSVDGTAVVCRAPKSGSMIVELASAKVTAVDIPAPGARLAGSGKDRKLVWVDKTGVWSAPASDPKQKTRVAPEPPLRAFLASHDGARAVGVYSDFVYFDGPRKKKPADVLMGFALDGTAARRQGLPTATPLDWSHDNKYVLLQDGGSACLMRAIGGQYKCWKGFTAVSIAPDGSYALVLGTRKPPTASTTDDVPLTLPSGPLSLYRAKLNGPYDEAPALIVKIVDGAAVWIPKP